MNQFAKQVGRWKWYFATQSVNSQHLVANHKTSWIPNWPNFKLLLSTITFGIEITNAPQQCNAVHTHTHTLHTHTHYTPIHTTLCYTTHTHTTRTYTLIQTPTHTHIHTYTNTNTHTCTLHTRAHTQNIVQLYKLLPNYICDYPC